MSEVATPIPLAEWQAEVEKRGKLDCKFVCPICGNVASMNTWKEMVSDLKNLDRAAVECIGRVLDPQFRRRAFPTEEEPDAPEKPCDYAAFGLLNICKVSVAMPDGKTLGVFDFAEDDRAA